MNLPPMPPVDDFLPTSGRWTTALAIKAMHEYAEAYARAAIAAHVPEAGCGNIAALAAVPAKTVTPLNVGRWCMSEDECRALGIDFAAYERGVSDAAEAFGRNKP